jgi:hypothetical protein
MKVLKSCESMSDFVHNWITCTGKGTEIRKWAHDLRLNYKLSLQQELQIIYK